MNQEDQLMAVAVETSPRVIIGTAELLFERTYLRKFSDHIYDISPSGERFLMIRSSRAPDTELILVQNWAEELKRLVPTGGSR